MIIHRVTIFDHTNVEAINVLRSHIAVIAVIAGELTNAKWIVFLVLFLALFLVMFLVMLLELLQEGLILFLGLACFQCLQHCMVFQVITCAHRPFLDIAELRRAKKAQRSCLVC